VARLAKEIYSEGRSDSPISAVASDLPEGLAAKSLPAPSVPVRVAGLPSEAIGIPAPPGISASSTSLNPSAYHPAGPPLKQDAPGTALAAKNASVGSSERGLTGGFPSISPAAPVHPVLESATTEPLEPVAEPKSGAHDPCCKDSYPFGEPRCNGTLLRGSTGEDSARQSKISSMPFVGYEVVSEPGLYFLGRPESEIGRATGSPAFADFDVEGVRGDFPALHQKVHGRPLIWFDNAATTQKPRSVIEATSSFYSRDYSNIHRAAHTLAARSTELFEAGREKVRQFLGAADAKEIVFLRGTTEAVNLVAQSYGRKNVGAGDEIILTEMEHHANIVPWQLLAEQVGAAIRVAPMNDRGELIPEKFAEMFGPRTKFVALAHLSNSLGTINPVEQVIALAHSWGVPVLIDGAQSIPHLPVNVTALDADFFVFSGHKVFGPTGIGALYGKAHLLEQMPPWQGGGHMIKDVTFSKTTFQHAPEKFEAGTPDIAGVVGLAAALDYVTRVGIPAIAAYEHELLEYATSALNTVPGLRPIGTALSKASVLSFVVPGVSIESIARYLDKQGIAVRAGHHCAMPAQRHFGLEGTVRPSLAFYNTRAEVDAMVDALHRLPKK
jgi:cysteine desulfurase / selenocysteine lyase